MNRKIYPYGFFLIFFSLVSINTMAGSYFRVMDLVGVSSLIDEKNESKNVSKGVYLPINAKIMVTQGSQLSLRAESGAVFHLSSGTVLEVWREQLVLLTGTMWLQSKSEEKEYSIETMNSVVEFKKAEFVMSFDDIAKKSQVFVISGHASIANVFMREKKELLVSGEISFIQKDFQQGMPRRPALIGSESLATVFSKFKGIKPGDENFQTILAEKEETIGYEKGIENFTDSKASEIAKHKSGVNDGLTSRSIASEGKNSAEGIYFIPKNFSAPKRMYPIKNRKIASESKPEMEEVDKPKLKERKLKFKNKEAVAQKSRGNRPVNIYDLRLYQKQNQWSVLLGTEVQESQNNFHHKKTMEKRAPANITQPTKTPTKPSVMNKEEDDFSELMKELKNVSSDHNEVY